MIRSLRVSLESLLQWLLILLMVGLTVIVMAAVIYRKLGASLIWYDEVASVLMAWITYYGAALAALKRQHIGFDGVLLRAPVGMRKVLVVIAEVSVIAFFLLLAWAGFRVLSVVGDDALISLPWVPAWFTQSVIPLSALLFIVCEMMSLPDYWRSVIGGQGQSHVPTDTAGT